MTGDEGFDFDPEELAMLRGLFRAEAQESLEAVTTRVLATGSAAPSGEDLTEMMRVTHTLKGAAGTVGLPAMVDLAHRLESALAGLSRGAIEWMPTTGDQIVEITDGMRSYLDLVDNDPSGAEAAVDRIRHQIDHIVRPHRRPETAPPVVVEQPPDLVLRRSTAEMAIVSDSGLAPSKRPSAPELAPAKRPSTPELPPPPDTVLPPPTEGTPTPEPKALLRIEPERIDDLMSSAGELLFDRTRIERRVQLMRTLARDLARTRQTMHDALGEHGVPSRALLVATEAELANEAALLSQTTAALLDEIEALRRTIGELQRGLTRIRMESARNLMLHAARTLRALRRATGVRVELRTVGEDTEFDKAVAEQLVDPITQLLRNAVAHGVEPPEERAAKGKPQTATITMRARQDGNLLVLELGDDGRGIDTAVLRERLVAAGHWTPSRAQFANDQEILDALLGTGVSVRGDADELAGRGIGIGLVRQAVSKLGGEVKVSSVPGRGTTFSLRLPLSTALAQAMLFKVGGQVYAIPNVHVIDTTLVEPHVDTTIVRPRGAVAAAGATVEGNALPVLRLEDLLGNGSTSERKPGIVVSFAGRSLVATVDKVVGSREIIIKPLGPLLAPLTLYAGATISGSGKVQLILDPAQLVRRAYPNAPGAITDQASAPMVLAGRALVVDDSRAIREAMTSMLGREGWIVDVAEDGARALQLTKQHRYDLVVTDLEMPNVDGFALIVKLREDPRFKATPIVIITSRANPEHRRRAKDLGVRALVAKPITRRKLLEALAAR